MAYEKLRGKILDRLSKKLSMDFTGSRTRFENKDHGVRLVVAVSKRYEEGSTLYWYQFNQSQIYFLNEANQKGYFIMVFSDSERAFKIPHEKMKQIVKEMRFTDRKPQRWYHVFVKFFEDREVIILPLTDSKFEFLQYEF